MKPAGRAKKTQESSSQPAVSLPRLEYLSLEHVSVYSKVDKVSVTFNSGVTCIVGANGIGKSTLLALITFGLTGAVQTNNRNFKDVADYRLRAEREARSYFSGRVVERDRDRARVTASFLCGETHISVTRRLLDIPSILQVRVDGKTYDGPNPSEYFSNVIIAASGLKSFDQYLFLIHFVTSFDEARHLLFWDTRAIEQILFIAFGSEHSTDAETARRAMERADSRVRNRAFEAKTVSDRIALLTSSAAATTGDEASLIEYEAASNERADLISELDDRISEASEATLATADRYAAVSALRQDYEAIFRTTLARSAPLRDNPAAASMYDGAACYICRSTDESGRVRARTAIESHVCPLCDAPYEQAHADANVASLEAISARLNEAQARLHEIGETRTRLQAEQDVLRNRIRAVDKVLAKIERSSGVDSVRFDAIRALGTSSPDMSAAVRALEINLREINKEKDLALARRVESGDKLRLFQKELEKRYTALEERFVPTLQKLAKAFLGLDITVRFRSLKGSKVALSLDVAGSRRDYSNKLSESQRFFVDIALRMALVDFLSSNSRGELYVDTPEGSLDIAYESRAGEMFAQFVGSGNDLVITANINTSALLRRLAEKCGSQHMQLIPMIGWTTLSEVQTAEQSQFDSALQGIQLALK